MQIRVTINLFIFAPNTKYISMIKDEWYTNKTWNGKIDSKFEDFFKRARGDSNKADILQIQGCHLLSNSNKNIQEVGEALLTRLCEDYPAEHSSIIIAQEKLGDYFLYQHDFTQAAHYFKLVIQYCKDQKSISGTSGLAEIKLADSLVKTKQPALLDQAYTLVVDFPTNLCKLIDQKFYHADLAARICDKLDKKEEAIKFAISAIEIAKSVKPNFGNKKNNAPSAAQLKLLKEIIAS